MWWIYALLSALFAALTAIFAKIGIKGVDTDLATAIRTVVILAYCLGNCAGKGCGQRHRRLNPAQLDVPGTVGLCNRLSWIFYFKALQLGKVSQVAPVDKLSVAIAIILSVIFLGEPLTLKSASVARC
jgi:transporter family protein